MRSKRNNLSTAFQSLSKTPENWVQPKFPGVCCILNTIGGEPETTKKGRMCIMAAIKIDKSLFTPEELAQYQSLVAKATINPEENEEEMEEDMPPAPPVRESKPEPEPEEEEEVETEKCYSRTRKSAADPALAAALARLDALEKSAEMKELTGVAKKYAALGENEEELAKTLYSLRKSDNPANYDAYITVLDKSLALVEKSGIFAEIGKSGRGAAGSVEDRIEAAATEIQKSDPSLSREQAVVKAWESNPDLIAEYERDYRQ